jgi:hypothetical protein
MGKPTWSGEWFARLSVGGALALVAVIGAAVILSTRPNHWLATLIFAPQFLIGTSMAIRALLSGDRSDQAVPNEGEGGAEGPARGGR